MEKFLRQQTNRFAIQESECRQISSPFAARSFSSQKFSYLILLYLHLVSEFSFSYSFLLTVFAKAFFISFGYFNELLTLELLLVKIEGRDLITWWAHILRVTSFSCVRLNKEVGFINLSTHKKDNNHKLFFIITTSYCEHTTLRANYYYLLKLIQFSN